MEKFQTVLDQFLKHHSALSYGLVTLLTAGGERIFSSVVFACPCSAAWNLPYGLVFLLVPALALFLLGYVLSARTWRLLTGCCAPGTRACGGSGLRGLLVCTHVSAAAALAPLTWVAVALLGGAFYECAASGSPFFAERLCRDSEECKAQLPLVPCGQAGSAKVQDLLKELKAQSQVLGWVLIAVVITVLLVFTAVTRCLSPVSFLQLKFWKIYLEQEQQILKTQATEHATELAKENIKCFFECSRSKEHCTPSMKDWQQISALYKFNPKDQYYSMLHKYVNRREKSHSVKSSEGDAFVPILGFVDSPGITSVAEL